jgi:glycosyltransferase involved in cell wall biosynthesis
VPEVERLGLSGRVVVREKVTDIEEYLQAADLGLFASDSESFCLSILEAMCFGVPSVATRVGGIPEVLLEGETGLLAPSGDAEGLAAHVTGLLRDGGRRRELGRAAKARAALFSAEAIVPQYEALYRRVAGSGAG